MKLLSIVLATFITNPYSIPHKKINQPEFQYKQQEFKLWKKKEQDLKNITTAFGILWGISLTATIALMLVSFNKASNCNTIQSCSKLKERTEKTLNATTGLLVTSSVLGGISIGTGVALHLCRNKKPTEISFGLNGTTIKF